jgi:hypothetical protein
MNKGPLVAGAMLSLVGACTSPLGLEGRLPPAGERLADSSYVLGPVSSDGDAVTVGAVSLVRDALAAKGYREAADGHYRLEIGFASAPTPVEVQREASDTRRKGGSPNLIVLCRPRRYVLTVGMIDRTSGDILFRNAAAARYCGKSLGKILPKMVRAAVSE